MNSAHADLGFARQNRRTAVWCAVLAVVLVGVMAAGLAIGPTTIPLGDVVRVIVDKQPGVDTAIVWDIRAPRIVLGAAAGAGLAVAGVVLQAVVRNLLADPFTLGINSGASTGAALAILFGVGAGIGEYTLQGAAFVGALGAAALMFAVARAAGRLTSARVLMAGIAVGYALSAVTSFLVFASDSVEGARSVMFWLLGSLGLGQWNLPLALTVLVVLAATAVLIVLGPRIDALSMGDDTARTLGLYPDRFRGLLVLVVCAVVGLVVAMVGSIGFVGLIVPHAARRLVGGTHRHVLPVAALLGASLLVVADIAARTLLAPQELPIGILTALVGAPFLLLLVRRMGAKA